jgi:acyl-CoA dehydrogenase
MRELLADTVERILTDLGTPAVVRAAEQGAWPQALWREIEEAGLVLALCPERRGGAGLGWRDVWPMLVASGRHAAPVPLGEAVAAQALAANADRELPEGIVTLGLFEGEVAGSGRAAVRARSVPHARHAAWVVGTLRSPDAAEPATLLAMRVADARIAPCERAEGDGRCDLEWDAATPALCAATPQGNSVLEIGAALRTAQIAGGIGRVLDLSVRYAGEREQFGKPIGKFQAVQQQLAQLGELAAASAMAAELACDAKDTRVDPMRVACTKARASEAAAQAAAIGHAVHGAIGVTEEHDLQLYTRRLWAWRLDFGSESHWTGSIGRRLLGAVGRTAWQEVMEASAVRA